MRRSLIHGAAVGPAARLTRIAQPWNNFGSMNRKRQAAYIPGKSYEPSSLLDAAEAGCGGGGPNAPAAGPSSATAAPNASAAPTSGSPPSEVDVLKRELHAILQKLDPAHICPVELLGIPTSAPPGGPNHGAPGPVGGPAGGGSHHYRGPPGGAGAAGAALATSARGLSGGSSTTIGALATPRTGGPAAARNAAMGGVTSTAVPAGAAIAAGWGVVTRDRESRTGSCDLERPSSKVLFGGAFPSRVVESDLSSSSVEWFH